MLEVTEFLTPFQTPKTGIDAKNRRAKSKSTWVNKYGYVKLSDKRKGLLVWFHDALIFYPDATMSDYESMRAAPSKGRWIWDNVYEWPYEILEDGAFINAIDNYSGADIQLPKIYKPGKSISDWNEQNKTTRRKK